LAQISCTEFDRSRIFAEVAKITVFVTFSIEEVSASRRTGIAQMPRRLRPKCHDSSQGHTSSVTISFLKSPLGPSLDAGQSGQTLCVAAASTSQATKSELPRGQLIGRFFIGQKLRRTID